MIRNRSSKDLGHLFRNRNSAATHSFPLHPRRSLQGLFRLARRRRTLAFALCAASVSGLATTAATVATVQHLHAAQFAPLAPAPTAPVATLPTLTRPRAKHHVFADLAASRALHGLASWYGSVWHGKPTASGEKFDEALLTACHRTLPFGTMVRVIDTASQRSVIVRINDRGSLTPNRVIDLSEAAATKLGILDRGLARVRLEVLHAEKHPLHSVQND